MSTENGVPQDVELIETTDENGDVHYFEKVEEVELGEQSYALLIYQGADDDEDEDEEGFNEEYVIMKMSYDDEGAVFEAIENEDEFNQVVKELESRDYEFDMLGSPSESDEEQEQHH